MCKKPKKPKCQFNPHCPDNWVVLNTRTGKLTICISKPPHSRGRPKKLSPSSPKGFLYLFCAANDG